MNTIIVNRNKHVSLLADHRVDPVTRELIKVGDEVVVCAKCKTVFFKYVWLNNCKGQHCEQKITLDFIPNGEFTELKKNSTIKKETGFAVWFAWFIVIVLIILILVSNEQYNEFKAKASLVPSLTSKANSLKLLSDASEEKYISMSQKYTSISTQYRSLKNITSNLKLIVGLSYDLRKSTDYNYGNYTEKVFFTVYFPIKLLSMKVDAKGYGYLQVKIYDKSDNFICEAINNEITTGIENLNFDKVLGVGEYYITHTGNTELLYNTNFNSYPILSNDIIEITGTSYEKNIFYMYYYDMTYAIYSE